MTTETTETTWQEDVLGGLNAPASTSSVTVLTLWHQSEGTPATWNNWLATELRGWTSTDANSAGVQKYPSQAKGVAATVAALKLEPYAAVVAAFVADAGEEALFAAINASPWCPKCQTGHYPVALYDAIQAVKSPAPAPATTSPDAAPAPPEEAGPPSEVVPFRAQVVIENGQGWFAMPSGQTAGHVVSVDVDDVNPAELGRYVKVPAYTGAATDRASLVFGPGPEGPAADGTYGFTYWYSNEGATS